MRVLAQLFFPKFFQTGESKDGGVQHYVETSHGFYIPSPPLHTGFTIGFLSSDEIAERLCYEINRFSCASLESLKSACCFPDKNRLSWSSVELYYSAYYAANGLMRFFGQGSTNLDKVHTRRIHKIATQTGMAAQEPQKGTYRFNVDFSTQQIAFEQTDGDGVHGKFWSGFLVFLDDLIASTNQNTLVASPEYISDIEITLKKLRSVLTKGNHKNGNWLSFVRNAINYRFEFGFWHPNIDLDKKHLNIISKINHLAREKPRDIMTSTTDPIAQYVESCLFIVAVFCNFVNHATNINRKKKYYLNRYSRPLIKELGIAEI